jgi:hypothetical protein
MATLPRHTTFYEIPTRAEIDRTGKLSEVAREIDDPANLTDDEIDDIALHYPSDRRVALKARSDARFEKMQARNQSCHRSAPPLDRGVIRRDQGHQRGRVRIAIASRWRPHRSPYSARCSHLSKTSTSGTKSATPRSRRSRNAARRLRAKRAVSAAKNSAPR